MVYDTISDSCMFGREKVSVTRVLVAVEPRMYREVLVLDVRKHRPAAEAVLAEPDDMEWVAESFEPDLVVGSRISTPLRETVRAWVKLAARDGLCAEVNVGGGVRRSWT